MVSRFSSVVTRLFIALAATLTTMAPASAQKTPDDSGMWLLPQIDGAVHRAMVAKGLELPSSKFSARDSSSINFAIIRINVGEGGGGTGSFVSSQGLILTNHHVAYDAIASASSAATNYLTEGFVATDMGQEIQAIGYTLYIPIEQTEVTATLEAARPQTGTEQQRTQVLQAVKDSLTAARVGGSPDLVAEIDDYWAGNRQFMSVYQVIRDVRLVFAPPSSIGKFGGDIDNWVWPRHTGDFTFLRAYVAPDGSAKPYSEENIPFEPVNFLQVSTDGYQDGDFTMIMGFPGTTYRHESSYDFQYYEESQIPVLIDMFKGIMAGLEAEAAQSPEAEVATASDRASYANSLKYFEGVYQGFKDYGIVDRRRAQEAEFTQWLNGDIFLQTEYGAVLPMLQKGYEMTSQVGDIVYSHVYTLNNSAILEAAGLFLPAYSIINGEYPADAIGTTEADSIRFLATATIDSMNVDVEMAKLHHFVVALAKLAPEKRPEILDSLFGGVSPDALWGAVGAFLDRQRSESVVFNRAKATEILAMRPSPSAKIEVDPFVTLYRELLEAYFSSIESFQRSGDFMNLANKEYVKAMLEFKKDSLEYPDANFTLRLTGGRVFGVDLGPGREYGARTFVQEIMPKYTGAEPFDLPQVQMDWIKAHVANGRASSRYADAEGRLVVNFITTNDITGGNSGSPIMNGKGEVIGLAFDGNIEGVVADYFRDPDLSRTINVDIRYVLHVTDELYGLGHLIEEMAAKKP